MKLLLTSAGLTNKSIANELISLLTKSVSETRIALVSTAANVEAGNKDWFVSQVTDFYKYGFHWVDIVDVSAPNVNWKERLQEMDVVVIGGGNTYHLLDQVRKSGFDLWLKDNMNNKVYVGISAGSILMTPNIDIAHVDDGDVNICRITGVTGLGLVDFEVSPHTPEDVSHKGNREYLQTINNSLYGLDNNSAISVNNHIVKVVSEGEWVKY